MEKIVWWVVPKATVTLGLWGPSSLERDVTELAIFVVDVLGKLSSRCARKVEKLVC